MKLKIPFELTKSENSAEFIVDSFRYFCAKKVNNVGNEIDYTCESENMCLKGDERKKDGNYDYYDCVNINKFDEIYDKIINKEYYDGYTDYKYLVMSIGGGS